MSAVLRNILLAAIFCACFPSRVLTEDENVCILYPSKDHKGTPLLSLGPSVKVFETNLVFQLGKDRGINVESVKLSSTNCSLVLCDGKHLQGNCSLFTESAQSIVEEKVHKNVRSVDCHCSSGLGSSIANETEGVTMKSTKLRLPPSSPNSQQNLQENLHPPGSACAIIFGDWYYKGQSQPLLFPGSTGRIDIGSQPRIRSISVKTGCTAMLWGRDKNKSDQDKKEDYPDSDLVTFPFTESNSFIQMNKSDNIEWACCYCDQCSENVCNSNLHLTKTSANSLPQPTPDFSQFVKHGKKIIGIGRNYRWKKVDLAKALAILKEPLVFLKPTTSYITEGQLIELPDSLGTIYYELELGVVMGKAGKDIPESQALDFVAGYFLALDMTAKEFIKGKGNQSNLPWEIGKGFDTACPVGDFIPKQFIPNPNDVHLECKVNGEVTQSDNTGQMIFNVQKLISYVSKYMTLEPYDVIVTGTPDGFGPLKGGDVVEGRMGNLTSIRFEAVASSR